MSEADNVMRWQRQPGHYEVWYMTLNHRASETGFWIRYTLEAPYHGTPYAQLWFACFDAREPARAFAFNRKFPIDALAHTAEPFELRIGDAVLSHGAARGKLSGAGHTAEWDLAWAPPQDTHYDLPRWIYGAGFADTKKLTPALNAAFRGRIIVDGRTLELAAEPGGQTHLWGRKHAHAWAWSHCNGFDGHPNIALETLTVRLRKKGVVLPPLSLLSLYLEGEAHHFRELHETPLVRGHWDTASYRLVARSLKLKLEIEYSCKPDEMVLTPYVDPDGDPAFCANTEIADCRLLLSRRQGFAYVPEMELVAHKTAHFEYASREPDPAIMRRHATVD